MSCNLTYGSFGDAITTAQLVYRLAQALSASRGSARELQDLVAELRIFQNVLQQVYSHTPQSLRMASSFLRIVDNLLGKQKTVP
jgi:hypothetical protein